MRKRVLILGATGMLGNAVYAVLKDKHDLVLAIRNQNKARLLADKYGEISDNCRVVEFDADLVYQDYQDRKGDPGMYLESFVRQVGDVDYVINAIGITINLSVNNPAQAFFINGALPHILANIYGPKLIHITTDCVYNGTKDFPYDEHSIKNPVDVYGFSKSFGEPANCLTLRTSIIGRELEGASGLLDWFLQQGDKEISGFDGHFWNGITTRQFGKICAELISHPEDYPKTGLYHIFSTTISKYEMLLKFEEKYRIGCKIKRDNAQKINRTLATAYELNKKLKIPSFDQMLADL